MKFQLTSNLAALASLASVAHSLTYVGCFSSATNLAFDGRNTFQSFGSCQLRCNAANMPIIGLTNGTDCLCGASAPPSSSVVADSFCDVPCSGYAANTCGGEGFFSVLSIPDPTPKRAVDVTPEVAVPGEAPIGGSGLPL